MAKQLNVNMKFNADSSQAKKELQSLQDQLHKLIITSNSKMGSGMADDIREATRATAELSVHLEKATNIKTGNLDFSKLNQSIKSSGKSLEAYGDQLLKLGPEGRQAFMQLTQSIVQAEVPLRRTNALIKEFATTLANTARWQLSSSVLHGFMGALQSAYGYAQDLNESLNNIRIVTGNSIDDMAKFAKEANKAAKALSTTTTAYTDASLIYFQQGLSEADVKKRADVTIKLANVTRQSAEDVSNQMTAIWNNFYNGSKSLEHYADVLSALGAATASSTEEIAGGLEKFAAIADTIGLSYDYAAAALATLTSNTRESEEVVGTALKTIFARIQGLNLGETLDDGTTLNKYSQALATVGINIQDATGNLKDMDVILDEMGSKWNNLSRAQQTALAQTVAGTRQYNQLMALMANWNNGDNDSFKANLATAQNADGTLQEQADIYADSWEAAQKRVKAAAEEMYAKLLNDEFFIDVLNAIEKIIGFVDNLIDRLGGLKGILFSIGTIVTKIFSDKIAQGMTNAVYNIQMMTKGGREKITAQKNEFIEKAANRMAKAADSGEVGFDQKRAVDVYTKQLERQQQLLDNAEKMNDIEKETTQQLMDQLKFRGELSIKAGAAVEQARQNLSQQNELLYHRAEQNDKANATVAFNNMSNVKKGIDKSHQLNDIMVNNVDDKSALSKGVKEAFSGLHVDTKRVNELVSTLETATKESREYEQAWYEIKAIMAEANADIMKKAAENIGASTDEVQNYANAYEELRKAEDKDKKAKGDVEEANQQVKESIDNAKGAQKTWADTLTAGVNVALSAASALSMLGSITDTLSDPDTTGWEKFTQVLMTISMLIPTLTTMWSSLETLMDSETGARIKATLATIKQTIEQKKLNKEKEKEQFLDSVDGKTKKSYEDAAFEKIKKEKGLTASKNKGILIDKEGQEFHEKTLRERVYKDEIKNRSEKSLLKDRKKITEKMRVDAENKEYLENLTEQQRYAYGKQAKKQLKTKDPKAIRAYATELAMADKVDADNATKKAAKLAKRKEKMSAVGDKVKGAWDNTKNAAAAAGPYLAIAAGIAVAAGAIAWGKAQFQKYSKAAEDAAKSAESAANAFNSASQAYDDFKSNASNFKEAQDGMKGLVKGTLEYNEAMIKANEAALALIEANEDLAYTVDSDGLIQIKEEDIQAIQEKKLQNMQKAQNAKLISAQNAKEAQTKSDMVDFARSDLNSSEGTWKSVGNATAATLAGAGSGALIGAGIGALGGPIGAAIGTAIGAGVGLITGVVGAVKNGSSANEEQSAIEKLGEEFRTRSSEIKAMDDAAFARFLQTDLKIDDSGLIKSLVANRDEAEKLAAQIAKNTDASYALNKQLVTNALADNKTVQNSKYKDEIIATTAKFAQKDVDAARARLDDSGFGTKGISQITKVNNEAEEVFAQYAKAAGIEGAKLTDTTGTDKNRKFIYKDKDGNDQEVTLEDMKDVVAQDMAMNGDVDAEKEALKRAGFGTKGISQATKVNDEAKDVFAQYAEAAGIEGATLTDTTGNDKNRQFVYTDKDGKEVTVDLNSMIDKVAEYNATENANARAKNIADIYDNLNKSQMAELGAAVNNDYSKLNASQMKSGFTAKTAADLGIDSDEKAQALGYDSITKLNEALASSASNAQATWNKTIQVHSTAVQDAMSNMADLTDVSFSTIQNYGNMLENLHQTDIADFDTNMKALAESAGDQADAVLNMASNIDWSQGQAALDQFNGQLYDMGINVDEVTSDGPWAKLQAAINNMSFSVINQNLDTLREKLKMINDVAKDIKIGDVISDEDYEKLTNVNGALKQDFVMTADGYMYVGDKDLKAEAAKTTEDQLTKAKSNNEKAKAAAEAFSNATWSDGTKEDWRGLAEGTDADWQLADMAKTLGDSSSSWGEHVEALGYDQKYIKELGDTLSNSEATEDQKNAARDKLKEFYGQVIELQNQVNGGNFDDRKAEELAASTMSYDDLQEHKKVNELRKKDSTQLTDEEKELLAKYEGKETISDEVSQDFINVFEKKAAEVELEEAERYAAVNHELETMEQHLSTINKLKDRASNSERIALIAKEADALKKQADAQADYLEEVKTNLTTDKTALSNYGFTDDMFNTDGSIKKDSYNTVYTTQLQAYQEAQQDLALGNIDETEFANREKAWQDFNEATDKYKGTLSDYADAQDTLIDSNNQFYTSMVTAYTETLGNAGEELSKYTARMEHHNSVLDHYKNLSILIGKETDYAVMNEYLEGQAHLAENTLKTSKASYAMYKNEADASKAKMDAAVAGSDNFKTYKEQWEAAEEKAREAENQMLADLQAWAESEKSILENTLADLGKTLEESLTGGVSFDKLNTQMERAASLQEDYLTTTNKIYETTKMMRTAQQAIDTSTNAVAKEKLKGFINETKSMQEQGKLSQYELDMQQAKYDLLVAEIALEEAQNAKSTVRLQRDSEGNFGYVYTADASAVGEAQQQFDDAQNALYNKGLEGANGYTQKYQETMSQMTDTLSQIQNDYLAGSYESEQAYQNAMAEAKSYYFEKLQSYSELYGVAVAADSKIAEEAWSTEFATMTQSTTQWSEKVDEYITGVTNAFTEWGKVSSTVEEVTGKDLSSIAAHVDSVTTASDALTKALLGENGEGGLIAELTRGFETVATTIQNALSSWTGITITTGENGAITVTPNTGSAATGGLTSAWGPEGKMLMVHENELILNSDQTNKFFDNLAIMESILSVIDSYAIGQQLGGMLASPSYGGNTTGALEQNVKIEASFPSVTDRNEIEEAFNNLVNKASQYANRK